MPSQVFFCPDKEDVFPKKMSYPRSLSPNVVIGERVSSRLFTA
jgi:hypothetical protein